MSTYVVQRIRAGKKATDPDLKKVVHRGHSAADAHASFKRATREGKVASNEVVELVRFPSGSTTGEILAMYGGARPSARRPAELYWDKLAGGGGARTTSTKTGMSATQRREEIAFANATADAMRKLGAKQTRPGYDNGPDALTIYAGDFTLDTKGGPLVVHAYGDSIMTRFEDPERGASLTSASMNGKWNWYPFMAGIERGKYDKERRTLALFLGHLRPILLPPGSPHIPARAPGAFDRELHRSLIGREGYAKHDFATKEFFTKSLLPSMRALVKREGMPMQAMWQSGSWAIMNAENQPTGRAFVLVDKSGKWKKGPKFDENILGGGGARARR